jgi:hypothetical protein
LRGRGARNLRADRLAVEGDVVPGEIIPLLLQAPGVSSAVLPVGRPPSALRRRPWRWPLRIGVLGAPLPTKKAVARAGGVPGALVDLRDVTTAPTAVDVLFITAPLDQANDLVTRTGSLANAVVVLDRPPSAWPIADAQLALLRATTSASIAALTDRRTQGSLAAVLGRLLRELTRAQSFDAALTTAFDRDVLITAEVDVLEDLNLPAMTRRLADDFDQTARMISRAAAARPVLQASRDLRGLSEGLFQEETGEASRIGPAIAQADRAIDRVAEPRWLQCRVESAAANPNAFAPGANAVHVFISPFDEEALAAGELSDEQLGFVSDDVTSVRATVVLVPLVPSGQPMRAELAVPRLGRSVSVRFSLDVPPGTAEVSARLLVLHRNRVLQTAVLSGSIGETARLTEVAAVRRDLTRLDDRRAFDLALFANHDNRDVATLIANSSGHTSVHSGPEIERISTQLREQIGKAAFFDATKKVASQKTRKLLIEIAVKGKDLLDELGKLTRVAGARRIQIVTSRSEWFLPLELVYGREAPDEDARICPSWLIDGSTCGPDCGTGPEDTTIVCPEAFWGMGKTIERVYYDPALADLDDKFLVLAEPSPNDFQLTLGHAVLGTSTKVTADAVTETLKTLRALDSAAVRAKDWREWITVLQSSPVDLLVLMPHTDSTASTLEISRQTLDRGRIAARYVTGGHAINPVVVLFGCDTTGSVANPAGFATRFLQHDAGLVFTSLTVLLNTHAALLSQRLARVLLDPTRRPQPVGEVMTAFRRAAVRDGLIAALGLTTYGDTDWTV